MASSLDDSVGTGSDVRGACSVSYFLPECSGVVGITASVFRPATFEPKSSMRAAHPWSSVVDVRIARPGSGPVVGHPETDHRPTIEDHWAGTVGRCATPADQKE